MKIKINYCPYSIHPPPSTHTARSQSHPLPFTQYILLREWRGSGIGIGCGCARKGRGTNGKREEYSPQDFNESGRYYCTNRRSGTIKFLALIVCLERESNSFLKCFKFALLPISYPGFFWRKIDSNYHILYCKYNRLPIIIFPLINIKRIIFLTLFYIIPILVSTFYLSYALFSRFYPILPFPPIHPPKGMKGIGCGRVWAALASGCGCG